MSKCQLFQNVNYPIILAAKWGVKVGPFGSAVISKTVFKNLGPEPPEFHFKLCEHLILSMLRFLILFYHKGPFTYYVINFWPVLTPLRNHFNSYYILYNDM